MTEEIFVASLIIILISVILQFFCELYENKKLKELVKQKDEEIKQFKRTMRDDD